MRIINVITLNSPSNKTLSWKTKNFFYLLNIKNYLCLKELII